MKKVTISSVLDVINKCDNLEISEAQVDENLTEIGMDSITFIKIIVGLGEAFECEIPDSKLLITEMNTVQKMIDILQILYDDELSDR